MVVFWPLYGQTIWLPMLLKNYWNEMPELIRNGLKMSFSERQTRPVKTTGT
jgi:hypothetical protein